MLAHDQNGWGYSDTRQPDKLVFSCFFKVFSAICHKLENVKAQGDGWGLSQEVFSSILFY